MAKINIYFLLSNLPFYYYYYYSTPLIYLVRLEDIYRLVKKYSVNWSREQ